MRKYTIRVSMQINIYGTLWQHQHLRMAAAIFTHNNSNITHMAPGTLTNSDSISLATTFRT